MNSRQRVLTALSADETPDHVPWIEQVVSYKVISGLIGRELVDPIAVQETSEKDIGQYCKIASEVYAELGLDGIACPAWSHTIADPVFRDGKMLPRTSQPGITDWNSFNKRSAELIRPKDVPFAQYVPAWSRAMGHTDMFLALAVGMQYRMLEVSIGFENMAMWSIEQPDLLRACAGFFCDWTCEAIAMILDRCHFDAVWLDDDLAFKTATFVSPAMLREFVFPYHRQIVDLVSSYKLPTLFHSDGNLEAILEDLIASGFVALHPLERLAYDIRSVRKKVGYRITVMGNVDIDFLEDGDPQKCFDETQSLIGELGPRRFVLTSGNSITHNVKPENLKAMSRALLSCR